MAKNSRPEMAKPARQLRVVARGALALCVAAISYSSMIVDASGPSYVRGSGSADSVAASLTAPIINASLSFSGTDVILTGSVGHLFTAETFVGPNRAAKGPRRRSAQNAVEIAQSFDQVRTRLATLRRNALPTLGDESKILQAKRERIVIAAIDPALMSAALSAIDKIDGPNGIDGKPSPIAVPQRLAYARANTPATVFKTPVSMSVSKKQLNCLSQAVYFEARGEAYRGQVAVAQVVMNRVNHRLYPNTICAVVFQNQHRRNACQFSFACDGAPERVNDKKSWKQAEEIARKVTGGSTYLTEVANATHYHASYVYPHWAKRMKRVTKIGLHRFYRFKRG